MPQVETRKVGIVMNGVTGRMGTNQHLMRSIVPIIKEGGLNISDTEAVLPDTDSGGEKRRKAQEDLAGFRRCKVDHQPHRSAVRSRKSDLL